MATPIDQTKELPQQKKTPEPVVEKRGKPRKMVQEPTEMLEGAKKMIYDRLEMVKG